MRPQEFIDAIAKHLESIAQTTVGDRIVSCWREPDRDRVRFHIGVCYREAMGIPRGERYELCRGVHAEQNAIIHAARFDMMGGTIYVAGIDAKTKEPIDGAMCCRLCKRMIINAGIERVVVRDGPDRAIEVAVATWIESNLGELARKGGKLVPVKLSGY